MIWLAALKFDHLCALCHQLIQLTFGTDFECKHFGTFWSNGDSRHCHGADDISPMLNDKCLSVDFLFRFEKDVWAIENATTTYVVIAESCRISRVHSLDSLDFESR